jgi:hypothetical protein
LAEKVLLLHGPQITHLPERAVVQRIPRSFALSMSDPNEFEYTVGRLAARVLSGVRIERLDRATG